MSEGLYFGGSFNASHHPSIVSVRSKDNRNSKVIDTDTGSSKEEHQTLIISEKSSKDELSPSLQQKD